MQGLRTSIISPLLAGSRQSCSNRVSPKRGQHNVLEPFREFHREHSQTTVLLRVHTGESLRGTALVTLASSWMGAVAELKSSSGVAYCRTIYCYHPSLLPTVMHYWRRSWPDQHLASGLSTLRCRARKIAITIMTERVLREDQRAQVTGWIGRGAVAPIAQRKYS